MQPEEIYRHMPELAKTLLRSAMEPQGPPQGRITLRLHEGGYIFVAGIRETAAPQGSNQFQDFLAAWNCLAGLALVEPVAMGTYRLTDLGYRVAYQTLRED